MQCSDGTNANSTATLPGPVVTLSPAGQAAQATTTTVVVIAIIVGICVFFATIVVYRDRLPSKFRHGLADARWKISGGLKEASRKIKGRLGSAGFKTRTFFSGLAFKIKHRR
jgi:hypothetical protein